MKAHKKIGPGGIKCPCCTPMNSVKKTRIYINRSERRKFKQNASREEQYGRYIDSGPGAWDDIGEANDY